MSSDDSWCSLEIGGPVTKKQYQTVLDALESSDPDFSAAYEAAGRGVTVEFDEMYWTYDSWMEVLDKLKEAKINFDAYRQRDMDGNDSQNDAFRVSPTGEALYDETWYLNDAGDIIDANTVRTSLGMLKEKFLAGELHESDFDTEAAKITFDPPKLQPISFVTAVAA